MELGTLVSLSLYFAVMIGIGLYAFKKSTSDMQEYMLGGRNLSPKVTALSAGASDMSGWMLLGVPGAMYVSGLSSIWIAIGLSVGAYLNYIFVAPRLRVYTELAKNSLTLPDFFENRFEDNTRVLRIVSSIVIIVFFTLYTSSGVVAGGKLFESSFGIDYISGLYITAGVVVVYTLFGGFLAVSLTDFVQGCIMFISLVMVPIVVLFEVGGISEASQSIQSVSENMMSLWVDASTGQTISFIGIVSLMSWGVGYFGQPHIIVRFMAIRHVRDMKVARRIGMSWMIVSLFGAVATGLLGLAYVTKTQGSIEDPETIFIYLSQVLFNPFIGGFLLAAILAAIMSTISSQLLVTSSSLTGDFYQVFVRRDASQKELVFVGRISVALVAGVAIAFAYNRDSTVLNLVSNAWAGFGAAFGPLVLFSLYWKRMTLQGAIAGMVSGALTVLIWVYAGISINGTALSSIVYEIVPGFIVSCCMIVLVSRFTAPPKKSIQLTYQDVEKTVSESVD